MLGKVAVTAATLLIVVLGFRGLASMNRLRPMLDSAAAVGVADAIWVANPRKRTRCQPGAAHMLQD
jgi:hypothetical protein